MTFPNPTNPPTIHLTRINFAASSRLKITGQQFRSTLADTLFIRSNSISVLAHYPTFVRIVQEIGELANQALRLELRFPLPSLSSPRPRPRNWPRRDQIRQAFEDGRAPINYARLRRQDSRPQTRYLRAHKIL